MRPVSEDPPSGNCCVAWMALLGILPPSSFCKGHTGGANPSVTSPSPSISSLPDTARKDPSLKDSYEDSGPPYILHADLPPHSLYP